MSIVSIAFCVGSGLCDGGLSHVQRIPTECVYVCVSLIVCDLETSK
jgi:hypothetical protein